MLRLHNRSAFLIPVIIFFVAFGYRLWGITNQFEVWDESTVVRYGEEYLNFIKQGDFSKESWSLNKEHPPFSKYFYGATRIVSLNVPYFRDVLDQDYTLGKRYTFQRIVSALVGAVTVLITYFLTRRFYGKQAGALAAVILSFIPYFVAHSRVATQENLVTMLTTAATALFFVALDKGLLRNRLFIISGLVLGLAISTKYNAFFFLVLFAILALVVFRREFTKSPISLLKNHIILIPIISLSVLYLIWPWLWPDLIGRLHESFGVRVGAERFSEPATEFFLSKYPHTNPWYYFFVYFFATTPIILLIGLALFFGKLAKVRNRYDLWFALWFLTPFLATFSPLKIDGIRYIFPVYPALAIVSAVGFYALVSEFGQLLSRYTSEISFTIYSLIVGSLILTDVVYHPFYLDYYNSLAGGPKLVSSGKLFDFGYWGEGIRDAVRYVNEAPGETKRVYLKMLPVHVVPIFDSSVKLVDPIEDADYVIINPTGMWLNETNYLNYDFPEHFEKVYEETIMDTPIITIYMRKEAYNGG